MRNAISNSILGRTAAAGALLLGAAFAGQAAMACTLNNWSANSGAVAAGDPQADGIARYAGLCGMEATGAGYVQDNNPGGIDRIVARFYVYAGNSATASPQGERKQLLSTSAGSGNDSVSTSPLGMRGGSPGAFNVAGPNSLLAEGGGGGGGAFQLPPQQRSPSLSPKHHSPPGARRTTTRSAAARAAPRARPHRRRPRTRRCSLSRERARARRPRRRRPRPPRPARAG